MSTLALLLGFKEAEKIALILKRDIMPTFL